MTSQKIKIPIRTRNKNPTSIQWTVIKLEKSRTKFLNYSSLPKREWLRSRGTHEMDKGNLGLQTIHEIDWGTLTVRDYNDR